MAYLCSDIKTLRFETPDGVVTLQVCTSYINIDSGYKLTNEQMGSYILAIALMFATVAVFKIIRRSFF